SARRFSLPMDRVVVNIEHYGNTSAASIPIALDESFRSGRSKAGDNVLMVAFGGGLSWAAAVVQWTVSDRGGWCVDSLYVSRPRRPIRRHGAGFPRPF